MKGDDKLGGELSKDKNKNGKNERKERKERRNKGRKFLEGPGSDLTKQSSFSPGKKTAHHLQVPAREREKFGEESNPS